MTTQVLFTNTSRDEQIKEVLRRLRLLSKERDGYAIYENIRFFEATQSFISYVHWLFGVTPHIDGSQLLEINELLPEFDEEMHEWLTRAERKSFPGLLRPLVNRVCQAISTEDKRTRLLDAGAGGMEVERQLLFALLKHGYRRSLTVVAVDSSEDALIHAGRNLSTNFGKDIRVVSRKNLSEQELARLEGETSERFLVITVATPLQEFSGVFADHSFNVSFSSLVLHHIPHNARKEFAESVARLGRLALHYDGYRSDFNLIPQSIFGWKHPIFLNAAIFSNLRYYDRKLLGAFHDGWRLAFYHHAHYLAEHLSLS